MQLQKSQRSFLYIEQKSYIIELVQRFYLRGAVNATFHSLNSFHNFFVPRGEKFSIFDTGFRIPTFL